MIGDEKVDRLFNRKFILFSPINGEEIDLKQVPDKVFASQMMGEGVGLIINGNKVYAPCDANIVMIPATNHAIGLKTKMGVEILIHIGLNTVELNGEGLTVHVETGARVRRGELLISFDQEFMNKKRIDLTTVMVITNSNDYNITYLKNNEKVVLNSEIMIISRK